ncbi:anti-sigma factor domain-containing protein [uncultured Friedmanniella sp.]|uniref:anti-sigma factor domain-containing protein n=1 Tax=uncultured Friedmanniella sp. TaxID=335381 RepID=UPI0035CC4308
MRHLDDELLAGLALGEPDRLELRDRARLLLCLSCRARLAELRRLVATGRAAPAYAWQPPRPGLLTAIQAELAADPRGRLAEPVGGVQPAVGGRGPRLRTPAYGRRLLAAAAVLVVAAGGALWYRQDVADVVVARATLAPLPDKSGQGVAQLVRRDGVSQLRIEVTAPAPADRFEELWLINTDGRRMISLGVVPPDGRASYPVPTTGGALDGYTIVDISLEPYDGNIAHSRNSVLRGTLDP